MRTSISVKYSVKKEGDTMAVESHIITNEKDKMIDMLLSGFNIKDIADACKVSRPTIYA